MTTENKISIFLVDDDPLFVHALKIEFLLQGNFNIHTYASGELCISNLAMQPDVIVLDYHLDGINSNAMNGLDTLDRIKQFKSDLPVIMLSSQDKIDVAVNCMRHRAFDYIVKSETSFFRLKKAINALFSYRKMEQELQWYMERM